MAHAAETLVDVVLQVDAFSDVEDPPDPLPQYFREEVTIAGDLFPAPMADLRRDFLEACEPRGINWDPPEVAYPVNFVMGQRDAPRPYFGFDPDRRLHTCIQLSRLVQPTSLGYGRAGRIRLGDDGEFLGFAPSRITGGPGRGWVAERERNWFDDHHVPEIAALVENFDPEATLPERVLQALWHHEHAHQVQWWDDGSNRLAPQGSGRGRQARRQRHYHQRLLAG